MRHRLNRVRFRSRGQAAGRRLKLIPAGRWQINNILVTLFIIMLSFITANTAFAIDAPQLQQQRVEAIKDYVRLLGKGDYQSIPKLFTSHGVAVSASGESDSIDHFYESLFSKTIFSPQSRLINIFDGQLKNNMMTAYYNLAWVGKDGMSMSQKFIDLFIFQADSSKIKTIYVFSNSFQESDLQNS